MQVRNKLLSNDAHNMANTTHPARIVPPRWKYCIFVDQDSLRSVEKGPEDLELKDQDGGETDNDDEEVGWMYMDMKDYIAVYDRLTSPFAWQEHYERPYKSYVESSD